ncbi:MAG: hypothetical protein QXO12_02645 [Candidatus Pacearchaeota archaeon]
MKKIVNFDLNRVEDYFSKIFYVREKKIFIEIRKIFLEDQFYFFNFKLKINDKECEKKFALS